MRFRMLFAYFLLSFLASAQHEFSDYFRNKSLRYNFYLTGNSKEVHVFPESLKEEPYWGGSITTLIDPFDYGSYRFRVFDLKSDSLIFSRGFCTLFQEWRSTAEAKVSEAAFYQAAILPYPKRKVRFEIDERSRDGQFITIFGTEIDPDNYFIRREIPAPFKTKNIMMNGKPENTVDIVILAEGYTTDEMDKFTADATRLTNYLFEEEPFKSEKNKFNVTAILTPSEESGTDIPGESIYRNTRFNSTFYTFDLPRYLTTKDMENIYDAAALVPYDQIYVLVNTSRYGGGGFYNLVTVCSADNERSKNVFVHEFGHGFGGLGDEYYDSSVAYEDFYNLKAEPWEPNLTTLINFEEKWKSMIPAEVPVPTPRINKYKNKVGVFEGAGYMNKGIYSPAMDCRMKTNEAEGFCPVCSEAIRKMIVVLTR